MAGVSIGLGVWFALFASATGDNLVDQTLLDRARAAQARQDEATRDACLRAWMTRQEPSHIPKDIQIWVARLRAPSDLGERIRVFGSRSANRIRVGFVDPAGVVDQLKAWSVDSNEGRTPLVRTPGAPEGRQDFRVSKETARIVVELMTHQCGPPLAIVRWTSEGTDLTLPMAPQVVTATAVAPKVVEVEPVPEAGIPWWWLAASVVAASLAGAALWQELR